MSKINTSPRLSKPDVALEQQLRAMANQINGMSEGNMSAAYNALTAAPTTGTHQKGDFVRNSAPAEAGAASSKYVVFGFLCVAGGSPGTWLQCRFLTGN